MSLHLETLRRKVTTDDRYSEVLYTLVPVRDPQAESDVLINHLQQAFQTDTILLQGAKEKQARPQVLNLEVVEAKGLKGKGVNGLSDPFCTLYLANSTKQKHNTSVKPQTLSPVWKEYFSFPVRNIEDDTLHVEIWDYDPNETFAHKMKRFGQSHEFLGCLKVPLKTIPVDGADTWFTLGSRKGNGHKNKGQVHIRIALRAEKEKKVAVQDYHHVLILFLIHELIKENIERHQWEGHFPKNSDLILRQLEVFGGLTQKDIGVAKWLVYTRVQCVHALNANVFYPLFQRILEYVKTQSIGDDEIREFWSQTERFVENFATFLRNERSSHEHHCVLINSNFRTQTNHMLKTLELLKCHLETREHSQKELEGKISLEFVMETIKIAIERGADELFFGLVQQHAGVNETEVMIKIGHKIISDLQNSLDTLHSLFKEHLDIDYFDIIYVVYDTKYQDLVKPFLMEIYSNLQPLDLRDDDGVFQNQDVTMGTNLLKLYLVVKKFADLSSELSCGSMDLCIKGSFHNWFRTSIAQWLDNEYYVAMSHIRKAVELDSLKPTTDGFKQFTSSAVDTTNILHQIPIDWSLLAWPEIEWCYAFITKIPDVVCRCAINYAEMMWEKVDEMEKSQECEISDELCFAINSIERVGLEMNPICEKLGMRNIIRKLREVKEISVDHQCEATLVIVMETANENVSNKIIEVLKKVGNKLRPVIQRLLLEGSETGSNLTELIKYLDKNLIKLKDMLTKANFEKMLVILWENVSVALKELIKSSIEKRKHPSFFKQIHNMLQTLVSFFYPDEDTMRMDAVVKANIQEIKNLIGFHATSTPELILKYSQDRYETQNKINIKTSELGSLTVRAHYSEDTQMLRIEILNARNLKPHVSNGQCDPIVKLELVPQEIFQKAPKFKSKPEKNTLCPLFDETFSIKLTPEEMSRGGMAVFCLKNHYLFKRNEFIGECFLPLESVPFTKESTKLQDLPQMFLSLSLPKDPNAMVLQTLENRKLDTTATDFVMNQRQRIVTMDVFAFNPVLRLTSVWFRWYVGWMRMIGHGR